MILTAEHPVTNLYLVEVSGWDDNKTFFVEHSDWGGPRNPESRSP